MILPFLLAAVLSFLLTEKVVTFAIEQGRTLQIFEPFVWVFGDGISISADLADPDSAVRGHAVSWTEASPTT